MEERKIGDKVNVKLSGGNEPGTIIRIDKDYEPDIGIYLIKFDDSRFGTCHYREDELENIGGIKMKEFKKENLIIGDYLYLKNGEVLLLGRHGSTHDIKSDKLKVENPIVSLSSFNDSLEHAGGVHAYDVIRVDRLKPCFGNTRLILEPIWERKKDEIKEMTLDEISKELGYNVKIIKG